MRLAEERAAGISGQVAQKIGRGRPEGGVSRASREIGVTRDEARRAEKIDSLAPEAKEAAIAAGLDKNQSALLDARPQNAAKQSEGDRTLISRQQVATDAGMSRHQQVTAVRVANVPLAAADKTGKSRSSVERSVRIGERLTPEAEVAG